MEDLGVLVYKYAVKNAYEHGKKAQVGAVIGKAKALFPEINLKETAPLIAEVVNNVNLLSAEKLAEEYKFFSTQGWELKHEEKEKTLPGLDWLKPGEKLSMRVAPNPSGAMHFGHARPAVLNDEYVKKYNGVLAIRFDDTDPKTKTPVAGIEKEFAADFEWLGVKFHSTVNASDHLPRFYEILGKLLADGNAYICTCNSESWRKLIWESKPCPCRQKNAEEQLELWKKMLAHQIREEEAIVRIKSDLADPDPSTRDWWLAKIVDNPDHPNPRAKDKHVWPSYNLASAVDDHDMGINFIVRGQEHMGNEEKQKVLYKYFGWIYPHTAYHGKISKLGDMTLSKSKIKELMEKGGLTRDDDPRLATIKSFRRRGFTPQAIRKIILDCGLSKKEVKISMDAMAAANKAFLGEVNEFPFFEKSAQIEITNMQKGEAECYGETIKFGQGKEQFIIDAKELAKYAGKKGAMARLKKAFNIMVLETGENKAAFDFVSYGKATLPIISWIKDFLEVEVLMNDGTIKRGISAKTLVNSKGVVHLEGLGYVNIEEKKGNTIKCVYAYE